jgi:D-serine deaminase-like pyridoxal phosphate-dependent protein
MTAMTLDALPTPVLLLDLARVRRNARRMSELARAADVALRPHAKTHKCAELARLQVEAGAQGLTVSTLAEARAFGAAGFCDLTYAVPVEPGKFAEVIRLHEAGIRLGVVTADPEVVEGLRRAAAGSGVAVPVHVEIDCGDARTGLAPDDPLAIALCQQIADAPPLRFAGLLTHAGHSYDARDAAARVRLAEDERLAVVSLAERLREDGVPVDVVSVGSTPTVKAGASFAGVTEARPGNYLLSDLFQATLGTCDVDDCAVSVLAAVVDRNRMRRSVVLDAGAIALSKDRGPFRWDEHAGYGRVLDLDGVDLGLRVANVSQEHGEVRDVPDRWVEALRPGARVRVLVNHACLTVAQHDVFHVLEDGQFVDRWAIHRGWH